ncbi:CRISPR-associated helicase/endonuclease Cas3 [Paenibacillus larvae subsp. pulvifaciens]|uniref:CRISPR-associated helicase/endonuclease Cas3 n=1 Tax=Paenibacillus larvae subsp. pulvifaciens TaxID=1477 RepID=A0A1V0UNN3_9BACL|nr:CRISPR-associated helicase/endonuclease Cas3 [Paenibacillus larvae]ARF66568.1 CRISPR-associated helicase/endonuclease Cas3 [Paenibacillus larvae subsp. pulvifaciens]
MKSIAHIRESDKRVQTVEEHLLEVRHLAEKFGRKLKVEHVTGLAGMLHDMGKYTHQFTEYILAATSGDSTVPKPKRGSVDHSTAGGKLLYDLFHTSNRLGYKELLAEIVGNAIISHHSYLKDFLNRDLESAYLKRVRDTQLDEYELTKETFFHQVISEREFQDYADQAAAELEQFLSKEPTVSFEVKCLFLTKFVFSALIDADRTNTRLFEANKIEETANVEELFHVYYTRLMSKIRAFKESDDANTPINLLRSEMSEQCDQFAMKPSGIYTLSIPTGGGKTLASLRYALKHALTFHKKRIIYVVPYTTIIEQNAAEVRRILNDEANILEHHSNVIDDNHDNDEDEDGLLTIQQKLKLAKDNWDAPIIFTTMVQFLNVFFAKGSRNIRRLHNLCESVLIFDEVQKIPTACVSLFNQALNFLKTYGRSSIVLCTATQPALNFVEQKLDIQANAEMIARIDHVIEAFKRVEIIDKATDETFDNAKLSEFVKTLVEEVGSVLIILNTKSAAKSLYKQLNEQVIDGQCTEIPLYHLSTSMCASHRNHILQEVKEHLSKQEKVICISTQLIEAGVDISFDCVIRSLAGLDSIAQAAGRCNRHGKDKIRKVYIIDHAEENLDRLKEIKVGKQLTKKMLVDLKHNPSVYGGHLLSRMAMERYFQEYYTKFESDLNYFIPGLGKSMMELLFSGRYETDSYYQSYARNTNEKLLLCIANSYGTAAEHFRVIDDHTTSVIVPYGKGKEVIADLNGGGTVDDLTRLLRNAQQFTVNLFDHEIQQLDRSGGLDSCMDGKVLVLREGAYNEEFGIDLENDSPVEFLGF